jgi:uncharacterized SAM-binding protein YcdF (DUF218 family)
MMEEFLHAHNIKKSSILRNPHGNNTLSESRAAYAIITQYGGGKIICATSSWHALRVWLIWFLAFGIIPEIYSTKLKPPRWERLKELIKIPKDGIRALLSS